MQNGEPSPASSPSKDDAGAQAAKTSDPTTEQAADKAVGKAADKAPSVTKESEETSRLPEAALPVAQVPEAKPVKKKAKAQSSGGIWSWFAPMAVEDDDEEEDEVPDHDLVSVPPPILCFLLEHHAK